MLVYRAAPLPQHSPPRSLHCLGGLLLEVQGVNLKVRRFGRRAFHCTGPILWNKLPTNMRNNSNLLYLKKIKFYIPPLESYTADIILS